MPKHVILSSLYQVINMMISIVVSNIETIKNNKSPSFPVIVYLFGAVLAISFHCVSDWKQLKSAKPNEFFLVFLRDFCRRQSEYYPL